MCQSKNIPFHLQHWGTVHFHREHVESHALLIWFTNSGTKNIPFGSLDSWSCNSRQDPSDLHKKMPLFFTYPISISRCTKQVKKISDWAAPGEYSLFLLSFTFERKKPADIYSFADLQCASAKRMQQVGAPACTQDDCPSVNICTYELR